MGGGGVNYSRQGTLNQLFSWFYSDHYVTPVNDNMFSWISGRLKKHKRMCCMQESNSGLLTNDGICFWLSYSTWWVVMGTMQFYVIQTCLFSKTISFWYLLVMVTEQVCIHEQLPWVQSKLNQHLPFTPKTTSNIKYPHPHPKKKEMKCLKF